MATKTLSESVRDMADAFGNVRVSVIPTEKLGRHGMEYARDMDVPVEEILRERLQQNQETPESNI